MKLALLSGTNNRFALFDACAGDAPPDPSGLARALAHASGRRLDATASGGRLESQDAVPPLDGVLLLERSPDADVRLTIYNADGSRPESCGNGLRCAAWYAHARGLVKAPEFSIETDSGIRLARILSADPPRVRVGMGRARVIERDARLATSRGEVRAICIETGNPHCVVFDADLSDASVHDLGPQLECHARFPKRTNVEFARATAPDRIQARVWERGVGETEACGSGACATAFAGALLGWTGWPCRVALPGGELIIGCEDGDRLTLEGDVTELGAARWIERQGASIEFAHGLTPSEVRARIVELAARHGVRVSEQDGASGELEKRLPFLGSARASYRIGEHSIVIDVLERPRGLSAERVGALVGRALREILAP